MKVVSSKRKADNNIDPSPKRKKNNSDLEMLFFRFPYLSTKVLKKLDNQSLMKLKQTSAEAYQFIENDKTFWIRKFKSFIKGKNKKYLFEWERAIKKTPMDMVRKLLKGVKKNRKKKVLSPLHIAAEIGNIGIFKYIFNKVASSMNLTKLRLIDC